MNENIQQRNIDLCSMDIPDEMLGDIPFVARERMAAWQVRGAFPQSTGAAINAGFDLKDDYVLFRIPLHPNEVAYLRWAASDVDNILFVHYQSELYYIKTEWNGMNQVLVDAMTSLREYYSASGKQHMSDRANAIVSEMDRLDREVRERSNKYSAFRSVMTGVGFSVGGAAVSGLIRFFKPFGGIAVVSEAKNIVASSSALLTLRFVATGMLGAATTAMGGLLLCIPFIYSGAGKESIAMMMAGGANPDPELANIVNWALAMEDKGLLSIDWYTRTGRDNAGKKFMQAFSNYAASKESKDEQATNQAASELLQSFPVLIGFIK